MLVVHVVHYTGLLILHLLQHRPGGVQPAQANVGFGCREQQTPKIAAQAARGIDPVKLQLEHLESLGVLPHLAVHVGEPTDQHAPRDGPDGLGRVERHELLQGRPGCGKVANGLEEPGRCALQPKRDLDVKAGQR